jgi:hypothetical protein
MATANVNFISVRQVTAPRPLPPSPARTRVTDRRGKLSGRRQHPFSDASPETAEASVAMIHGSTLSAVGARAHR